MEIRMEFHVAGELRNYPALSSTLLTTSALMRFVSARMRKTASRTL